MLNRPPRNAKPTASPARMYGHDQISVSEIDSARPNEPCQRPPYARIGSPPVSQIRMAPATSPVSTASAWTSSVSRSGGLTRMLGQRDVGLDRSVFQAGVDLLEPLLGGGRHLRVVV